MTNEQIKAIYLAHGFKEKDQGEGRMDLNQYVYDAARALLTAQLADLGWLPCSPALLEAGVDCATAPRVYGGQGVSHYHQAAVPANDQAVMVAPLQGEVVEPDLLSWMAKNARKSFNLGEFGIPLPDSPGIERLADVAADDIPHFSPGSGNNFAVPAIGAARAGGDWNVISAIIDQELAGENVTFVEFNGVDAERGDYRRNMASRETKQ